MIRLTANELDIILGICAAIIGILAFANELPDKKYLKRIRSLAFKLVVFVLATIIGVWATLEKNSLVEKEKSNEKLNSRKEQRKNDLLNRRLTDMSNAKIVSAFTDALAKYNLKYDSTQKVVLKEVRDSSKRTTKITYGNHPELEVDNISFSNSKVTQDSVNIRFTSKQATSYHTVVKIYCLIQESDKPAYLIPNFEQEYLNNIMIPPDKAFLMEKPIGEPENLHSPVYYFIFIGSYKDLDGKAFDFKIICSYNLLKKSFGASIEPTTTSIINFIHKHGIDY